MRTRIWQGAFWMILLASVPALCPAAIIRVPADRPTIQAGVDAAVNGDTVLVAEGTWSGPGNRLVNFGGKEITVQSEHGRDRCVIDLDGSGPAFILQSGEGRGAVIRGFTVWYGQTSLSGCGVRCIGSSPIIIGCRFSMNETTGNGGAIFSFGGAPWIQFCQFGHNSAGARGGAVSARGGANVALQKCSLFTNSADIGGAVSAADGSRIYISECVLSGNTGTTRCGAISCEDDNSYLSLGDCEISGNYTSNAVGGVGIMFGARGYIYTCLIHENFAGGGGGVYVGETGTNPSRLDMYRCTIAGNEAAWGGGVGSLSGDAAITDCIIYGNTASQGAQIYGVSATFTVNYCCVQGGWSGTGNISANPLFAAGPFGNYYLSHRSAGQGMTSPCIDAGDPDGTLQPMVTRTDGEWDVGRVDIGYHRMPGRLAAGPGPAYDNPPLVRLLPAQDNAVPAGEFSTYGVPHYGVNVCAGIVWHSADTEATEQIITGAGPGAVFGPHVRGFFVDGTSVPRLSFLAYGTNKFGVNVAAGHLLTLGGPNNSDEIVTGAGPGAVFGPHVRAFHYDQVSETVSPVPGVSFFAYGTHKWGVNVACGDIDGDGYDEIVTGAGPGAIFGPHVRGWNVDGATAAPIPGVSFLAYGTNKFGVNVSCGDIDGDGIDEIVTAPGPSGLFGAHIRGWNYDGIALEPLRYCSAFAWPPGQARYGAKVFAGSDMDGDGFNEIVIGGGPDPAIGTPVLVLDYSSGEGLYPLCGLEAFPAGYTRGATVVGGPF